MCRASSVNRAQRLWTSYVVVFKDNIRALLGVRSIACFHASGWRLRARSCFFKCTFFKCAFVKYTAFLAFILLGESAFSFAQGQPANVMEYQIKAAFLYKFCLYVEWPPTAFSAADSPLVFGIAAPDDFIAELNTVLKNHTINDHPLQVRRIDGGSDVSGVQLLFVARSQQALLPQLRAQAQGLPLLLITESERGLNDGGVINFALQDNRVRFEVALDTANRQGLHLSAQLLKVARNVRGEAAP
jgi:hypothetical protein